MGKVRVFWQALFSYTFTGQKTRSSKCQSWDGDDRKNHPCPGYVATVFFFLFSNSKKSILSQKKKNTKSWISPPPSGGVRHTCVFSLRRELQKPIRVGKTVINIRTKTRVRLLNTLVTQCNVPLWKFLWLRSFGQKERWYLSKKTHLSRRAGKSFRFTQSKPLKKKPSRFFLKTV